MGGSAFSCEEKLEKDFLNVIFSSSENYAYRKSGFVFFDHIKEVFMNVYTQESGEKLQIRAMNSGDVMNVTKEQFSTSNDLKNGKWNKLFNIDCDYYIASASYSSRMYMLRINGGIDYWGWENAGIRPVVSLKSNLKTSSFDLNGFWNIQL